jgi:pyruvate kinase
MQQKRIIQAANHVGKPVITATQMLESMVSNPRPTRAEVTDVANAIFDGTDAVMLSGETAAGDYPIQAARMMDRIAREVEPQLPYIEMLQRKERDLESTTFDAISHAAVHTAQQLGAKVIIAFTSLGLTARQVAKYRPRVPILAATPDRDGWHRLTVTWGITPYLVPQVDSIEGLATLAKEVALNTGLAEPGDRIVIVAGVPIGTHGSTNLLRVEVL